jgi:tRNA-dihydrouridine synthase
MNLHLDLYEKYEMRPYDPLKRFFKIYVNNFPGASEIREQLMQTKSIEEARAILKALGEK